MRRIVKVSSRGQTTIPEEFRRRFDIREGDYLLVEDEDNRMVIRTIKSLKDLGGVDSEFGTPEQLTAELEKLREEFR
ncbi:MAG: AbrB/MazE/SpoVT family DNA-binding domain-containing protein [Thermoplasmata archaeon]|nr:AbrB/MazE/SpoVT family DNA-binding domain-containing protein [Thermoplasmata archaeon]